MEEVPNGVSSDREGPRREPSKETARNRGGRSERLWSVLEKPASREEGVNGSVDTGHST